MLKLRNLLKGVLGDSFVFNYVSRNQADNCGVSSKNYEEIFMAMAEEDEKNSILSESPVNVTMSMISTNGDSGCDEFVAVDDCFHGSDTSVSSGTNDIHCG